MGTGLARAGGVVHWSVVRNMVIAWCLTLPCAGLVGAGAYGIESSFSNINVGVTFVAGIAAVILVAIFFRAQTHNRVGADNVIEPEFRPEAGAALAA